MSHFSGAGNVILDVLVLLYYQARQTRFHFTLLSPNLHGDQGMQWNLLLYRYPQLLLSLLLLVIFKSSWNLGHAMGCQVFSLFVSPSTSIQEYFLQYCFLSLTCIFQFSNPQLLVRKLSELFFLVFPHIRRLKMWKQVTQVLPRHSTRSRLKTKGNHTRKDIYCKYQK